MSKIKRILCLVMAVLFLVGAPVSAAAEITAEPVAVLAEAEHKVETVHQAEKNPSDAATDMEYVGSVSVVNPWYEKNIPLRSNAVAEQSTTEDFSQAAAQLRQGMVQRQAEITVICTSENTDGNAVWNAVLEQAFQHTGNPTEGDYIARHYNMCQGHIWRSSKNGVYHYTLEYNVEYYTTASQEAEMDIAVAELLESLQLDGKSSYEKFQAVYSWMCDHITYDHENLSNEDYKLKYTAYAALINRTAVCQGYANLLYRLMLELGVDCRLIRGYGNDGRHGWNIVRLGDYYYNADATWDAGGWYDTYCLRCDENFDDHVRDSEYDTEAFRAEYKMAAADYSPYGGGSGTEADPYLIATKDHLDNVRNNLSAHYKMTADIRFSEADFAKGGAYYHNGSGWQPIGTAVAPFTGSFDGNGHTISGLKINIISTEQLFVGLFGHMKDGIIRNLGLLDSDIYAESTADYDGNAHCVGGIVGQISDTANITNCYNTGNVTGKGSLIEVGGIEGGSSSYKTITITDCNNTGRITALSSYSATAAGIAGHLGSERVTVSNCYNQGGIYAESSSYAEAGGIVGWTMGTLTGCYNTGTITAKAKNSDVGGIVAGGVIITISNCYNGGRLNAVGESEASVGGIIGLSDLWSKFAVTNCFNTGKLSAVSESSNVYSGGVVGYVDNKQLVITNCYNAGNIASSGYIGGIVGYMCSDITLTDSYYIDTDDKGVGYGTDTTIRCTETQMQKQSTFAGFDFNTVWTMAGHEKYPYPELQAVKMVDLIMRGDLNEDEAVTDQDAIYLLLHTLLGDKYPINQDCDFNGDGVVTDQDAIYLLLHTLLGDKYPI